MLSLFCHLCLLALLGLPHITGHCERLVVGDSWMLCCSERDRGTKLCPVPPYIYNASVTKGKKKTWLRNSSAEKPEFKKGKCFIPYTISLDPCRIYWLQDEFQKRWPFECMKSRTALCTSSNATLGPTLETFSLHPYHCLYFSTISEKLMIRIHTSFVFLGCMDTRSILMLFPCQTWSHNFCCH